MSGLPGGAGCVDHGVHNTRDEHRLAQQVAGGDDCLLHQGHLLGEQVQAQVAARHYRAVGR